MPTATPFLMFAGQAEAAMRRYVSLFPDGAIEQLELRGEGEDGAPGTVRRGVITVAGQRLIFFDSPVKHAFGFTPGISIHVAFENAEEVDRVAAALGEGGGVLMGLGAYPFSPRYTWLVDRYGVSWQLSAAAI